MGPRRLATPAALEGARGRVPFGKYSINLKFLGAWNGGRAKDASGHGGHAASAPVTFWSCIETPPPPPRPPARPPSFPPVTVHMLLPDLHSHRAMMSVLSADVHLEKHALNRAVNYSG